MLLHMLRDRRPFSAGGGALAGWFWAENVAEGALLRGGRYSPSAPRGGLVLLSQWKIHRSIGGVEEEFTLLEKANRAGLVSEVRI